MTATVATTTITTSDYEDDDTKASAGNRNSGVLALLGGPFDLVSRVRKVGYGGL